MKAGMKEQITGYLGELSVERFFLLRDINCRGWTSACSTQLWTTTARYTFAGEV